MVVVLTHITITEANDTELKLESEAANSAMAEETSATSEELAAQVVTLNELVGKFELN